MEISDIKKKLTQLKNQLEQELGEIGVHSPTIKTDWVTKQIVQPTADQNDVADHTEEYATNRSILAQLETRYNNVVAALDSIELGTYGICTVCGNKIEEDRLHANPAANTCINHKDLT